MGAICLPRIELISTTNEIVGYKSGIDLNREKMYEYLPNDYANYWYGEDESYIRIRSEEFEEIISSLLYKTGNISQPLPSSLVLTSLIKSYLGDDQKIKIASKVINLIPSLMNNNSEKVNDPTPLLYKIFKEYGIKGVKIAEEILYKINEASHVSPWSNYRRIEWKNLLELKELFDNESLETYYGSFIDQRFIDYLYMNIDDIFNINWRKFEGLTCEFFENKGYKVEIGEGRGDGGIDARVWKKDEGINKPPLLIIQCKRHKNKIKQTIVKALWADLIDAEAKSGLIVTTSKLSPSSEKICKARGYPIQQIDNKTLRKWIQILKSPYTGIFMGE